MLVDLFFFLGQQVDQQGSKRLLTEEFRHVLWLQDRMDVSIDEWNARPHHSSPATQVCRDHSFPL